MSSRNDSVLLTGMNSSSVTKLDRVKAKEELRLKEKQEKKQNLFPAAKELLEMLEKEKNDTILSMLESVDTATSNEDFKSQTIAMNMYKQSVSNLKTKITNIMRTEK